MRSCVANLFKSTTYGSNVQITVRFYPRWAHRQPAKVLTPEEYDNEKPTKRLQPKNLDDNIIELDTKKVIYEKNQERVKKTVHKSFINPKKLVDIKELDAKTFMWDLPTEKREKKLIKYTQDEVLNTTFDENGNYVYVKMKNNDPRIGTLMLMVKSKKLRNRQECILLEGKSLIKEALLANCKAQHILFTRKPDLDDIKHLLPKENCQLYKIAYRDMQYWSDLTTPPGLMGIFKIPKLSEIRFAEKESIPLTIICDNIREPGNLGAILRAGIAVGAQKIILTKGCVDLWEPKVLRSSCGAHFRAPVHQNLNWNEVKEQIPQNSDIFLADNNILTGNKLEKNNLKDLCVNVPVLPYYGVDFSKQTSIVLVIGGETLGLSEESYRLAAENKGFRLNIPLNNDIESLNTGTALGIIAFEIKRQLLFKR